MAESGSQ